MAEADAENPPDKLDIYDEDKRRCAKDLAGHGQEDGDASESERAPGFISRTLVRFRANDSIDPGPPPDGGFQAWSTAFITHLVVFNVWGFINSYGLFQTYYVETMKIGGPSDVAWIGTTQVCIIFAMGAFTGRGLDGGYFRLQTITGSVIYVFGLFMLSLCDTFWQIFLAQAICVGIGYGLVYVPTVSLISTYFLKKRSTATAICITGSTTGGLVFPAIAQTMFPKHGFGWTVRVMALVQLVVAIISAAFLKPRLPPRKTGPLVELAAFKELPYLLYNIGAFFFFLSLYVVFFFIDSFATTILNTGQATGIHMLMVLNGTGMPGRLVPAYIAQRWTGSLNLFIPQLAATAIIIYSWIAVKSTTGLWIFAVFYGTVSAGLTVLFPVVLASFTADPQKLGVRSGMCFSVSSFAILISSPIAGALIENEGGGFLGLQLFTGTSMALASVMFLSVRLVTSGFRVEKV